MSKILELLQHQYEGAPVWGWIVGATVLHFEYWLARTKKVAASSTLELIPNILFSLGGKFVPGLGMILSKLGTPKEAPKLELPDPPASPPPPPKEAA